ncbi:DUF1707 domain-containing protein [Desertihabitans brevis]|uniref:DUF1707 domain-containing protein n=1 Tax=Desertihabitans brevis TaxID=2268447 RepID=A0A367YV70_9ACTN|nr:DUF1707 domain-containing protein [Desertihabitans brevis]RCK69773.1 DUF1707 domain-containing protein [Desertihabitans brevis]
MEQLPISSKYRSSPDAPVEEQERASLSEQLNAAYTEGRIDSEEYHRQLDVLFSATRLGDLVPVVTALGPRPTHQTPAIVESGRAAPGELTESRRPGGLALVVTGGVVAGVVLVVLLLTLLLL